MDQPGVNPQETKETEPHFSVVLTPNRSLGPRGFLFFLAIVATISFIAGMAFLLHGAWPVMGFFALDVLLIYLAFKLNYHAASAYETVAISGNRLTVTRVRASGRANSWSFNPYWARLELKPRLGRVSRLVLSSHGRGVVLGSFLSEAELQDFAAALTGALHDSRALRAI